MIKVGYYEVIRLTVKRGNGRITKRSTSLMMSCTYKKPNWFGYAA